MPAYRIYKLDGSGRFLAADWLEADDDRSALKSARSQSPAFELWHGDRLVGRRSPGAALGDPGAQGS